MRHLIAFVRINAAAAVLSLVIGLVLGFAIVAVSLLVFPAYWPNVMPVLGVGIGCGVAGAKLLRIPPRASSHARAVIRA